MDIIDFQGSHKDGIALIVLGGPSAKGWIGIRDTVKPDVILGANGVNVLIPNLDFWMCIENMRRTFKMAAKGDKRAVEFSEMFRRIGSKTRIVHRKSYRFLTDTDGAVAATKAPSFEANNVPDDFSFRSYGNGFIKGALMKDKNAIGNLKLAVGTVGLQLIHLAGILGVREVHTIGFDLCFRDGENHHAYKYPAYQPNLYFLPGNFVEYRGVRTMSFWIESARYLLDITPEMNRVGLQWVDHSDGLLSVMKAHA